MAGIFLLLPPPGASFLSPRSLSPAVTTGHLEGDDWLPSLHPPAVKGQYLICWHKAPYVSNELHWPSPVSLPHVIPVGSVQTVTAAGRGLMLVMAERQLSIRLHSQLWAPLDSGSRPGVHVPLGYAEVLHQLT